MAGAIVNPAFVPLSKQFHITVVQASYELTVYIVFAGIGPLLTVPLANVYGRRPVYLLGNLVAAVTNIGAGYCNTWTGIMVTRVSCSCPQDLYCEGHKNCLNETLSRISFRFHY